MTERKQFSKLKPGDLFRHRGLTYIKSGTYTASMVLPVDRLYPDLMSLSKLSKALSTLTLLKRRMFTTAQNLTLDGLKELATLV